MHSRRHRRPSQPLAPRAFALWLVALSGALAWVFWPSFVTMHESWATDSRYSHGYLVPLFSAYLFWSRRDSAAAALRPSWWGMPVLALGLAARFAGTVLYFDWLAAAALLPCLAGLALLLGGGPLLRRTWPALAFLLFMIPLPFKLEIALGQPLQWLATVTSTYVLQTLGFVVVAEGNTIRMGDIRLGVVEACSGLSMLMIFFALATAAAVVVKRRLVDRLLICISAIPIAVAANITRIIVTGVLHKLVSSRVADIVFHDLAGWLMMPLALGLLWVELRLLDWLLLEPAADRLPPVGRADRPTGRPAAVPAR